MLCPVCSNTQLVMTERQGIEIDYCPTCRGVWLDRGELDKIIERSLRQEAGKPLPGDAALNGGPARAWSEHGRHGDDHDRHHGDDHDRHHGGQYGHGQQRHGRSFWSEIFD